MHKNVKAFFVISIDKYQYTVYYKSVPFDTIFERDRIMNADKYYDLVTKTPLFMGAEEKTLTTVLGSKGAVVCCFHSGEEISVENKLAIVIEGCVYARSVDSKRSMLLRKIEAGGIFGVASLFSDCNRVSRIYAKGSAKLLFLERDTVQKMLETDKMVMYNYISFLSGRICYLNKKITYLTAGSTERKLAVFLADYQSDTVTMNISFAALADTLDIGRASLYRALDNFEKDGCIERDGETIKIVNKALMLEKY